MLFRLTADLVILIHFGFICFVLIGGFMALKRRWLVFLHIPCVIWGALIEFYGWICPLTPFEQQLRQAGGEAGYSGGFIDHYIVSIIYPSGLTHEMQIILGILVILINIVAYALVIRQVRTDKYSS